MDWQEVNCVIDALRLLIEKYELIMKDNSTDEDEKSDAANDLAYAEIILHKYEDLKENLAAK